MSDSEKTNELDTYGVWVKKPPRTVNSEEDELPDFSGLADDEPSEKKDSSVDSKQNENTSSMEEVSLDEFGFSDEESENQEESAQVPDSTDSAESSDIVIKDNSTKIEEDSPIDIDLSFDDSAQEAVQEKIDDGTESVDLSEFDFDDSSSEIGKVGRKRKK